MKNELATRDCLIYKPGDIIIITNMMPKPHAKLIDRYPIRLITEITYSNMTGNYPHQIIRIKSLKLIKYTYNENFKIKLFKYRQAIRPATEREKFLYHIEGEPFIMEDV